MWNKNPHPPPKFPLNQGGGVIPFFLKMFPQIFENYFEIQTQLIFFFLVSPTYPKVHIQKISIFIKFLRIFLFCPVKLTHMQAKRKCSSLEAYVIWMNIQKYFGGSGGRSPPGKKMRFWRTQFEIFLDKSYTVPEYTIGNFPLIRGGFLLRFFHNRQKSA